MAEHDRIRWRCRRGLLELDLVLERFLATRFDGLDAVQRGRFDELLDEPDNELLDLALGRAEPAPRYRTVVDLLRAG
jgi:succinate dehydrogenase / fumarate reductase iron-sulfur subunit/antitoxin CptB